MGIALVQATRGDRTLATVKVPVHASTNYRGSTTVGGSGLAASLALYKSAQAAAVGKILVAVHQAAVAH